MITVISEKNENFLEQGKKKFFFLHFQIVFQLNEGYELSLKLNKLKKKIFFF